MTSEKQRKAGWLLPETITGYDLMLVCLCIPDEPYYRAAFRGAINALTKHWNWEVSNQEDYARRKEAAGYWTQLLGEQLNMPCNICELMAACLDNLEPGSALDLALQNWLIDQLTNNDSVVDLIGGGGLAGSTPVDATYDILVNTCDKDLLFGWSLQTVRLMHSLILDLYEIIEVVTNYIEALAAVSSEAQMLGVVIEFVAYLQDNLVENYLANYDVALEHEYACDLFCLALENGCTLTWEQLTDYFFQRMLTDLEGSTINTVLIYVMAGVWTGDEFCHASFALLAFVMRQGGDWAGISLEKILNIMGSFYNDPDSDWSLLCTSCIPWCHTFYSSNGDIPSSIVSYVLGSYNAVDDRAEGETVPVAGSGDFLDLEMTLNFPQPTYITDLEVTFSQAATSDGGEPGANEQWWRIAFELPLPVQVIDEKIGARIHEGVYVQTYPEVSAVIDSLSIRATIRYPDGNPVDARNWITHIKICGKGYDPFV